MSRSLFLKIKAVISVLFGISMAFFSSLLMPIYGVTLTASGTLAIQWAGACLFGIGLICWFASNADRSELVSGILLSLCICDTIGFVVSLLAQLAGVMNVLGWSTVGLWLILALGLGYFRFIGKES